MKNIGPIQEEIIILLREYSDGIGYIGRMLITRRSCPYFKGRYWEEVEGALNRLIARGIIRQVPDRMDGIFELISCSKAT